MTESRVASSGRVHVEAVLGQMGVRHAPSGVKIAATIVAVVLAVGARFIGHASSATWQLSATSAAC